MQILKSFYKSASVYVPGTRVGAGAIAGAGAGAGVGLRQPAAGVEALEPCLLGVAASHAAS